MYKSYSDFARRIIENDGVIIQNEILNDSCALIENYNQVLLLLYNLALTLKLISLLMFLSEK